ncbi:DUF6364 family protein [Actinosynnema sp. NPDC004786]
MSKRNVTLQLDDEVIKKAKVLAAREGTSLSALLAHQITVLVAADERYEAAKRRALAALDHASDHGGLSWNREDLYDR